MRVVNKVPDSSSPLSPLYAPMDSGPQWARGLKASVAPRTKLASGRPGRELTGQVCREGTRWTQLIVPTTQYLTGSLCLVDIF